MSHGGAPVRCACGVISLRSGERDIIGARSLACGSCGRFLAYAEPCSEADYRASRKTEASQPAAHDVDAAVRQVLKEAENVAMAAREVARAFRAPQAHERARSATQALQEADAAYRVTCNYLVTVLAMKNGGAT